MYNNVFVSSLLRKTIFTKETKTIFKENIPNVDSKREEKRVYYTKEENKKIDLSKAKQRFVRLMRSLNSSDHQKFLAFIAKEWEPEAALRAIEDDTKDSPTRTLKSIILDIKQRVPIDGVLPSETFVSPSVGENSDCNPDVTLHVDEFLYTDDDVDTLVDNGQLQSHYCHDCGSKNIRPLIYISHSMRHDRLTYTFSVLLNMSLKDKTVLDIGSRLGAVLYWAYLFSDATRIIGVEMNEEFCNIQNDVVRKLKMDDRISVVNDRIERVPDIVKQSDVIIINNAFEFYLPRDEQINIWKYLRATIKSGTLLVTHPPIEKIFRKLNIDIPIEDWLKPRSSDEPTTSMKDNVSEISCYEVLEEK